MASRPFDPPSAIVALLPTIRCVHMPTQVRASRIIAEFEQAQAELVGKAVILTNGVAGTVEELWLDELHGLRMSIRSPSGDWPVSTIKFVQKT